MTNKTFIIERSMISTNCTDAPRKLLETTPTFLVAIAFTEIINRNKMNIVKIVIDKPTGTSHITPKNRAKKVWIADAFWTAGVGVSIPSKEDIFLRMTKDDLPKAKAPIIKKKELGEPKRSLINKILSKVAVNNPKVP